MLSVCPEGYTKYCVHYREPELLTFIDMNLLAQSNPCVLDNSKNGHFPFTEIFFSRRENKRYKEVRIRKGQDFVVLRSWPHFCSKNSNNFIDAHSIA